jgi:hypothetical protein
MLNEIISGMYMVHGNLWTIIVYNDKIKIGCIAPHTRDEWDRFTDAEISGMDRAALSWWRQHKNYVLSLPMPVLQEANK